MRKLVLDPYSVNRRLIRMSWNKQNLYNLVHVKQPPESTNLRKTVFQQKWIAKRELRAYHNPLISEKQFLARHFKTLINLQHLGKKDAEKVPPIQAISFGAELEKRADVIVFRSHFASSIWEARRLVVDGYVSINGEKCRYPCRQLEEGDMITVEPKMVHTLRQSSRCYSSEKPSEEVAQGESKSNQPLGIVDPTNEALPFTPHPYMAPWMFIPPYLEVNYPTCSTVLIRSPLQQPDSVEIPSPLPPSVHQLGFEWYASIKRRKTKQTVTEPIVINGKTAVLKPKFDRMVRFDQKLDRMTRRGLRVRLSMPKVKYTPRFIKVKA